MPTKTELLKDLLALKKEGVLTDAEFQQEKEAIMNAGSPVPQGHPVPMAMPQPQPVVDDSAVKLEMMKMQAAKDERQAEKESRESRESELC